jgi:phosphatidylglycerol:prolipoprotein diacylglycerol transferase
MTAVNKQAITLLNRKNMHPEFFSIGGFTIHMYGFMILIGASLGYFYMAYHGQKELGIDPGKMQTLAILIILTAFVGGKLLFYLEKPAYYFGDFDNIRRNFRQGFVFYGSLIFALPTVIWYVRKEKWPVWSFLDLIAITATIIHGCGRLGCFFAGCCYGLPTDGWFGITFSDSLSQAEPLNTPLHPSQLYEFSFILCVFLLLTQLKRHEIFKGRLIFVYIICYATGRGILELFRGDIERGFIIDGILSHSQFISLLLIAGSIGALLYLKKKA